MGEQKVGFSENLQHMQLVIKTITNREWKDTQRHNDVDMGGELGYWLCQYDATSKMLFTLAKFVGHDAIENFEIGLNQMVIFWGEGEEDFEDEDARGSHA